MVENKIYSKPNGLEVKYGYKLYLPEGYTPEAKLPMLVFLHGAGERGTDPELTAFHGPLKLVKRGREFPFIIVAPQCPANSFWTYEAKTLLAFISGIAEELGADEDKIWLTGLSMGGYGAWALGELSPHTFAAIAPICGEGMVWAASELKDTPVWAFHGSADPVVPVNGTMSMVKAINAAGGSAKMTIYDGVGHDSWTRTYENPELYAWLEAQKRH